MNQDQLNVLRCPICKGVLQAHADGLLCEKDALIFPIRDGMPIMLIEQAIKVGNAS